MIQQTTVSMLKRVAFLSLVTVALACNRGSEQEAAGDVKATYDPNLAQELSDMVELDQIAAFIPEGKYKALSEEDWQQFKDSVFTAHTGRVKSLFDQFGFLGYDQVGQKGSDDFWVIVQHSDHDPAFQEAVLKAMKVAVDAENASPNSYGLLVDRVRINTGRKQVYGTQVTYNLEEARAYPQPLEDSLNVNRRRASIGLEPIEQYLNRMTDSHYEMNEEAYLKEGIPKPEPYPVISSS